MQHLPKPSSGTIVSTLLICVIATYLVFSPNSPLVRENSLVKDALVPLASKNNKSADISKRFIQAALNDKESVYAETFGDVFKIPADYFSKSVRQKLVGKVNPFSTGINFQFCMPNGGPITYRDWREITRPVTIDKKYICPKNKSPSFVVGVKYMRFQNENEYISPDKQYQNVSSLFKNKGRLILEPVHGLQRYEFEAQKSKGPRYISFPAQQSRVHLSCLPDRYSLPNTRCHGYVHIKGRNLAFRVIFPRSRLKNWSEIVGTVRKLALRWRHRTISKFSGILMIPFLTRSIYSCSDIDPQTKPSLLL